MTTIRVKLRPSSVAGRPGSIVYLVTRHRTTRQITTGHKLHLHAWDSESSSPDTQAGIEAQAVGGRIRIDVERLAQIIRDFDDRRLDYTAADVVAEFLQASGERSFFCLAENSAHRLRQLGRIGTASNYCAALASLRRFRGGRDISLDNVCHTLMEEYEAYLRGEGLTPNTTSFYMRMLRAVYNRAVGQELTRDRKPFRTVFTGMEKTRKRAISAGDMRRVRDLELSHKPKLRFARDMFLFLFFCRGMSFIDAAYLRKTDIRDGVLSYRRHKTGQPLYIRVVGEIRDIISRHATASSPYLLPIIDGSDEGRRQYAAALHRVNRDLKTIGAMVGLRTPLTTYVSRHAWATIARRKNIPLPVISEALGHDSETTTRIYLASIDATTIDRANSLIIRDL